MNPLLSITIWNVQWATPDSPRAAFFADRFAELASQVICLTEGDADLLPAGGHVVSSDADYGYASQPGRRKVVLWSRNSWRDADTEGDPALPSGRFVAGTTVTPLGAVRFIGVCIPWRDVHVRTGRRDRLPWEDHLTYLQHLGSLLAQRDKALPTVVLGDFNQRIPCARQPLHVHQALMETFSGDLEIVTAGALPGTTDLSIDHLACTETLQPHTVEHLSRFGGSGAPMSDHFGLRVLVHHDAHLLPRLGSPRSAIASPAPTR